MDSAGFFLTDCESILSEIKHQQKQLKLKRRWLMGLPTSKSKRKQSKEPKFLRKYRSLPETLLRDDDIFYETIKTRVEESFGASTAEREHDVVQNNVLLFDIRNVERVIISCIDSLTNKGLYRIAVTLTGGSVKFENTRRQMKRVIKESLSKGFRNQNICVKTNILKQLSLLVNDPINFQKNSATLLTPTLRSHYAATMKVLAGLEDLPFQALIAMHRKLRGGPGVMPQLRRSRHGWSRGHIIDRVRKTTKKMLSELSKEDELQEPLARAMAIAGLSLKLEPGCQNSYTDFQQFPPEIKSLQNEIVKAIWLLKTKVRFPELKTLQRLLDPNSDVPNSCLRTAIKKMLIEYLFECSDMDTIPKSLLEALAIVNRSSRSTPHRCFPKEEIEYEVECVLSMSAHTKQIVWDLLPQNEFDQDFADAYMEELEESDDGYNYDDDSNSSDVDAEPDQEVESIGEWVPVDSMSPASPATRENGFSAPLTPDDRVKKVSVEGHGRVNCIHLDSDPHGMVSSAQFLESRIHSGTTNTDINKYQVGSSVKVCSSRTDGNNFSQLLSSKERLNHNLLEGHEVEPNTRKVPVISRDLFSNNFLDEDIKPSKQNRCRNQYLAIQQISDETSMVAYNLIGHMLERFAKEDEVDLDSNDISYLRGNSSTQECTGERKITPEEDGSSFDLIQIVKELVTSLPKSGREKLEKLMVA